MFRGGSYQWVCFKCIYIWVCFPIYFIPHLDFLSALVTAVAAAASAAAATIAIAAIATAIAIAIATAAAAAAIAVCVCWSSCGFTTRCRLPVIWKRPQLAVL